MNNYNSNMLQYVRSRLSPVQYFMHILPFLACITLICCSRTLCLVLIEGHHVDTYTILLRTTQCAAFVAPASVYLVHMVNSGPVLFVGACLTILGLLIPSLFAELWNQEVTFAVLYGSGMSVMFQATFMVASSIFRKNILCSVLVLGFAAAIMTMTQRLFESATAKFAEHIMTGLLTLILISCMCPAFFLMLGTSKCKKSEKDLTQPLLIALKDKKISEDEILKTSLAKVEVCSLTTEAHKQNELGITTDDFKRRVCVLLIWAAGVHFSFLLSFREWSTNVKLLSLTCVLSLVAFGVKTCGRKSSDVNDTVSGIPSGYFMLGLLGVSGLTLRIYPLITDVHYYSLLFSMGFLYQLKDSYFFDNIPQNIKDYGLLINHVCVELVFTFCALALGYLPAYFFCCLAMVPVTTNIPFPDVIVLVMSSVMILLSLKYSIRSKRTIEITQTESECNGQA